MTINQKASFIEDFISISMTNCLLLIVGIEIVNIIYIF